MRRRHALLHASPPAIENIADAFLSLKRRAVTLLRITPAHEWRRFIRVISRSFPRFRPLLAPMR